MIKRVHIYISFLFVILSVAAHSQQSNTLYFMQTIEQSNLFNPAFQPKCNVFVGFPLLSSFYFNYGNTGFSYDDIFPKTDNKRALNLDAFINQLRKVNYISFEIQPQLLTFGFRVKSLYFTFGLTEKINIDLGLPKDLFRFPWYGNTGFYNGTLNSDGKISFKNLGVDLNYYREYAFGVSKVWDDQHIFGIKLKLLFGKLNFNSLNTDIGIITDPQYYYLTVYSKSEVNASLPIINTTGNLSGFNVANYTPVGLVLNRKNWGGAIDMGFRYKYDEHFTYSASIIDLGFIRWRSYLNNISQDAEFQYTGPDASSIDSYFNNLGDTLLDVFDVSVTSKKYNYYIPAQLLIAGRYIINDKINFGLLSRNKLFQKRLMPSATASINTNFFKFLSLSVSYSYLNNSYKNAGIGISLHSRNFQAYLVNDNLWGMIVPLETRNLNFRFGINFYFGCTPKEEKIEAIPCFQHRLWDNQLLRKANFLKLKEKSLKKKKKKKRKKR